MKGNTLLDNISKLNTFIHMSKSNELLGIYVEKILNNKSQSIKFVNEFDPIPLDLLYTSLQIMSDDEEISKTSYDKIDKKELSYYLKKVKGLEFFKKQVPSIKTEEHLVNYIKESLSKGEYTINFNNTIKFSNSLVVDSKWTIDFAKFLITSLNNNINLSNDASSYTFNTVEIPETKELSKFLKEIKQYEYTVKRQDNKRLSYQDIKFLIDKLSNIEKYDFKKLQDLNSELEKNKYRLSVNKKNVIFNKEDKLKIEKLLNEESSEVLNEFVQDALNCYNSTSSKNKRKLIDSFEILRSLAYSYKNEFSINSARKQFDLKAKKEELVNALNIASFYINYVFDESNLHSHFNYSILDLNDLKPSIIDYETPEYKSILKTLSVYNKKIVSINRRINKYLDEHRKNNQDNLKFVEENNQGFARNCRELDRLVKETKKLRAKLDEEKDVNRHNANINKTKIRYIKESIINGYYTFEEGKIIFNCYSKEDYHQTFHLEITSNEFKNILLSEYNCNARINFYQI